MSELVLTQNDLDPLTDDVPADQSPEALKKDLANLIRRYVLGGRSATLAGRVVRYCQALYLHPALRNQPEEQDAFRELAAHWRRLGAQIGARAPQPSPRRGRPGSGEGRTPTEGTEHTAPPRLRMRSAESLPRHEALAPAHRIASLAKDFVL